MKRSANSNARCVGVRSLIAVLSTSTIPRFSFILFSTYFVRSVRITCTLHGFASCCVNSPARVPKPKTHCSMLIPTLFSSNRITLGMTTTCCRPCGGVCGKKDKVSGAG